MRIAYIRVSSRDQNLDMQLRYLEPLGFDKLYTEKSTGTKRLPELEKCLEHIREQDTLIVYKFDRLGRTLASIIHAIDQVRQKKATIISVSENIDSSTPGGRAMINMIALLAEYEHDLIVERCADGREAAKKRGVKFGRPTGTGNKEKSESCALLYQAGQTIPAIQTALDIKSRQTVYNYLREQGITPGRRKKDD